MFVLVANHDVNDFDHWKEGFDAFPPARGGATFHRVSRNTDDPNNVTVIAGFATLEAARAFASNPELIAAMGEAGVIGIPRMEISEEVDVA